MTPAGIGACTWTFGDLPLIEIARQLAKMGFDGVELAGDLAQYTAAEAKAILSDAGLQVLSLTPANVDLAHPDDAIRTEALDYYLRLLDFAAALGQPLVSCHGLVGRVRPVSTLAEERALLLAGVQQIAERAQGMGLHLVMEVLNRYESHLLLTAEEALAFLQDVGADNVSVLLDAYHMNIEEANPADALRLAGTRLGLYHVADSNRQGIGRGHTDFEAQMAALDEIGYAGPIILECTAPGPDPFTAIKDEHSRDWLMVYLQESLSWLHLQ